VKQLQPTLELEQVTLPTGQYPAIHRLICGGINYLIGFIGGAVLIDLAFMKWLRKLLGEDLYQKLDQAQPVSRISSHDAEGERMRVLLRRFDVHKRKFANGHRDIKIDLPDPFQDLYMDNRVVGGQITIPSSVDPYSFFGQLLTIFSKDMASFFEPCATSIIQLIENQQEQIENLQTRLKV
jgi:hypothetical protein